MAFSAIDRDNVAWNIGDPIIIVDRYNASLQRWEHSSLFAGILGVSPYAIILQGIRDGIQTPEHWWDDDQEIITLADGGEMAMSKHLGTSIVDSRATGLFNLKIKMNSCNPKIYQQLCRLRKIPYGPRQYRLFVWVHSYYLNGFFDPTVRDYISGYDNGRADTYSTEDVGFYMKPLGPHKFAPLKNVNAGIECEFHFREFIPSEAGPLDDISRHPGW